MTTIDAAGVRAAGTVTVTEPGAAVVTGPIELVLVDDHDVVRFGIRRALAHPAAADLHVAGEARTAAQLRQLLADRSCDVVVLDLGLGDGSDPAETVEWLVQRQARVLVYSIADDQRMVRRALAAGAHGLSRKSETITETLEKIRLVAAGQLLVSPDIFAVIDGDTPFVEAKLSHREQEVLVLYVSGLEVAQIAKRLYVTENSTKEYLRRIRTKYNELDRPAASKVDLLRRAIEDGLVPPISPQ